MINLKYPFILASGSPRRKELLEQLGIEFRIEIADVDEDIDENNPRRLVESLSYKKAKAVADVHPEAIVLGADTIVSIDDTILGKPKDKDDALRMLQTISGREHKVFTGVTIIAPGESETFSEETAVKMTKYDKDVLLSYIESGEPLDKAGGYAIQGIGSFMVESIHGNYHNVVGLPIATVFERLRRYIYV